MADPPRYFTVPLPTFGGKQIWADEYVFRGYRIQGNVVTGHHRLLGPRNSRLTWGTYDECMERFEYLRAERDLHRKGDHLVLLLHGIFRAKEAFNPMRRALHGAGFEAEAINYPSTQATIESHADQLERLLGNVTDVERVSFVTHSMGGLVARELLARDASWRKAIEVNRLVMIATPNQGALLADHLLPLWAFRRIAGPAAAQLTTDYVPELPPPDVPFGIIAGAKGDGKGYNPLLPGDDDLTVALESTHLAGAEDTLVVQAIHTFIMQNPHVIRATVHYLRTGRFQDTSSEG
jgi:pimeloyl-ACP methyl ester carboxylesterase